MIMQSDPFVSLKIKWQRARAKKGRDLLRTVLLRIWPFAPAARLYYRVRFLPAVWSGLLNRSGRRLFREFRPLLDDVQATAAAELSTRGIAITTVQALTGQASSLERVRAEAERMFALPEVASQIVEGRSKSGGKDYVVRAFGGAYVPDPSNEFLRLALNERILAVVSHYLGMWPRLKYIDLWYNVPAGPASSEVSSQRWHRDYDDYRMVKLFLYIEDVDAQNGPFMFIPETHAGARLAGLYPTKPPTGSYPPPGAVDRVVGPDAPIVCIGDAGTLVLADAAGFHKGGRAIARPRILFTVTYASDAAVEEDRYRLPQLPRHQLGPMARFAIRATDWS